MKPRPTTATFTFLFIREEFTNVGGSRKSLFHNGARRADVCDAAVAGFAFDDEVDAGAELFQCRKEAAPVHLTDANRNLLAPGARDFGPSRVLDVDVPDPRRQHAQRLRR